MSFVGSMQMIFFLMSTCTIGGPKLSLALLSKLGYQRDTNAAKHSVDSDIF